MIYKKKYNIRIKKKGCLGDNKIDNKIANWNQWRKNRYIIEDSTSEKGFL